MPKPRLLRFGLGIGVLALVLYLAYPVILRQAALYLVNESPTLYPADVAIVLSGDEGQRVKKAVTLAKNGTVHQLLMSGGPLYNRSYADYMADYAVQLGVKHQSILLESESESTYENATLTRPIVEANHFKRIIVVTSKFHTRRSGRIFRKIYPPHIHIQVVGADDNIDYNRWWTDHEMTQQVLTEWAKTLLYWVRY